MTDQEIVDGLINRDEKITDWFFNIKYRPLFINVIKLIFDYQVDYDECISELYYHLMKNDAPFFVILRDVAPLEHGLRLWQSVFSGNRKNVNR